MENPKIADTPTYAGIATALWFRKSHLGEK